MCSSEVRMTRCELQTGLDVIRRVIDVNWIDHCPARRAVIPITLVRQFRYPQSVGRVRRCHAFGDTGSVNHPDSPTQPQIVIRYRNPESFRVHFERLEGRVWIGPII
jgi:hypothetical protein